MRKISIGLLIFASTVFASGIARAQDAVQDQINILSGQIKDLQDANTAQSKKISALEKQISDLSDKLSQPDGGNFASADDLKKLAAQVQEIDKKRLEDNQKILDALEKIGKGGSASVPRKPPTTSTTTDNTNPPATGPQKGYEYAVQKGDTLSAIVTAYRKQGVKVSVDQIMAANPGLTPKNLIVGKTIFIPDPNAK